MSAAIEVSEGIPVEGRMFETPQISLDHQKPRYVTFLGSLIDRETLTNKPWTKGGGIIVGNPCLRYVKNFLRKGRITPVLKDTHDYRPVDLWKRASEGDSSYFPQPIPQGYVPPNLPDGGGPTKHGYMMGKLVLPGEQITAITEGTAAIAHGGLRRGVVEITSLKGQEYKPKDLGNGVYTDETIWEIQRVIFPNYPIVPVLIDDVGRMIQAAKEHTVIREVVDDYERSWEQFREYANVTIRHTHFTMREIAGASHGYIPTYTAMDLTLLEQLGLARQDEEIRKNTAPSGDPELRDMFKAWMQANIEEKQRLAEQAIRTAPLDQNTMAAAPIKGQDGYPGQSGYSGYSGQVVEQAQAEFVKTEAQHFCECGKQFGTPQGLTMHKSRHCPLKKTAETESTQTEA